MVGLVGLGVMGQPIAANLIRAGFQLVVHRRSINAVDHLSGEGTRVVATPGEVGDMADVILLALPDSAAVEEVVLGGLVGVGRLRPGTLVIDLSTIGPRDAIRIGEQIQAVGGRALDAPMSGGERAAIDGTLSLMVGGAAEDLDAARPVLGSFATTIVHVGRLGSGQVAKACNQLVVMGTIEIIAEALALAEAVGADPERVRTAMLGGLAQSRILDVAGKRMIDRDFQPGGRLAFHAKDIATIRDLLADHPLLLPGFEAAAEAVTSRILHGDGDLDHAAIVRHVRRIDEEPVEAVTITFATEATSREYRLPGRDWTLLLGPQNSPSRRMTLSLASFPPGSAPGPHVHPIEDEVVHVISGHGRLEADAGGGPLAPGVSFHVPAGLSHGAVNDGDEPLVLLCTFSPPVTPGSYDPDPTG